ncbi:DUF3536 domain-containing protein [bacterium]|nr:DUF3536 domain-containing protein [bacterium]
MSERYICIHGHFYQPPRENPWLEAIELQDSAFPYHDWNERITSECYESNATSRILNGDGRIDEIVNNYARISFDFGPTLLSWIEGCAPNVHAAVIAADRDSMARFGGHGSAMAQCYNHSIMPLNTPRDKHTQVLWGIRDFTHRFGREPEGMWLPECAVDLESLDMMAAAGIKFAVLAPRQAAQVRNKGKEEWQDANGGIDPTQAYECALPSGRTIAIFFYDGPISLAIAFEDLLASGERFAGRLAGAFIDSRQHNQLVHIATDGETYGHHHHRGEMALSYALNFIERNKIATLINYGWYLEKYPPTNEVRIHENSSWSCIHGIERWRANCGCNSGGHGEWSQQWRLPLRTALDWLRDTIAPAYEKFAGQFLRDPWAARDDYIHYILDRSDQNLDVFLEAHQSRPLQEREKAGVLQALELQRHAMMMYTSCGWFFDELSGIETTQVIMYAGRVVQLAGELGLGDYEENFLKKLELAQSNIAEHKDGRGIYIKFVKPSVIDLPKVGAHYAVSSMFRDYDDKASIYCFNVNRLHAKFYERERMRMCVGHAQVVSQITRNTADLSYAVLHLGEHNVYGGVRQYKDEAAYQKLGGELDSIFDRADLPELIRYLDGNFAAGTYSLRSLFRDEQRAILNTVLKDNLADIESMYRRQYEQNAPMMRFITDLYMPLPRPFQTVAEYALTSLLNEAFEQEQLNHERIKDLLQTAARSNVSLNRELLEIGFRRRLERLQKAVLEDPGNVELLSNFESELALIGSLPFEVNIWEIQNNYWSMAQTIRHEFKYRSMRGDEAARRWLDVFRKIGEILWVKVT